MADPSDFVSYSQLLGLTADDVARARERAQAEYDTATGEASSALAKSGQEARNRSYNSAAAVSVSQTGSYGDYLAARDRADAAYAKLHKGTRGGRGLDAVLDRAGADGAEDQGVDWNQRESALNAESGKRWQLGQDIDKSNAENAARRKAEEEARRQAEAEHLQRARDEYLRRIGSTHNVGAGEFWFGGGKDAAAAANVNDPARAASGDRERAFWEQHGLSRTDYINALVNRGMSRDWLEQNVSTTWGKKP